MGTTTNLEYERMKRTGEIDRRLLAIRTSIIKINHLMNELKRKV